MLAADLAKKLGNRVLGKSNGYGGLVDLSLQSERGMLGTFSKMNVDVPVFGIGVDLPREPFGHRQFWRFDDTDHRQT